MYRDIASIVAEKCINPTTNRPYTITMIEKGMADIHVSINPTRSAKQQVNLSSHHLKYNYNKALDVIKLLQEKNVMPIARAQMKVRLLLPGKEAKKLKEKYIAYIATIDDETWGDVHEMVSRILRCYIKSIGLSNRPWEFQDHQRYYTERD